MPSARDAQKRRDIRGVAMPSAQDGHKRSDIDGVPMVLGHPAAVKCGNVCGVIVVRGDAARIKTCDVNGVGVRAARRDRLGGIRASGFIQPAGCRTARIVPRKSMGVRVRTAGGDCRGRRVDQMLVVRAHRSGIGGRRIN